MVMLAVIGRLPWGEGGKGRGVRRDVCLPVVRLVRDSVSRSTSTTTKLWDYCEAGLGADIAQSGMSELVPCCGVHGSRQLEERGVIACARTETKPPLKDRRG